MEKTKQFHPKNNNYIILLIAVVLFALTFALGAASDSFLEKLTEKSNITDWRFINAEDAETLEADDIAFKQATASQTRGRLRIETLYEASI